uniref:NADH-ubiquinone oxidoreductase chain 3 n=2 Tax=Empoascanara TaxID=562279 RepID=A0AA51NH75_9HEMI|nr:NADH dehydrogenase subunit 3 [Empoascanara alami]YP_010952976.1 NADH dehydrogenase subunit 3 [Empoascanara hongkongica]WMQ52380.1 NADH dehydrogenase subunit 3 [Empoascanara alami]WMQ52419.1 NADH dehydrogenase subunit 3 [Empoascanara hongkongica]
MIMVLMFLIVVSIINLVITLLIVMINKKQISDSQKSSPFECGFNPMTFKRLPFSIHFFLIAVIFLIFDIEIIIILPMILTLKSSQMTAWLLTSTIFIFILILGLYHEWINGMLNWTK